MAYPTLLQAGIMLPFAIAICGWVTWSDLKYMKIPNRAVLAMAFTWIALGWIAVGWELWLWSFLIMTVVLVLGFLGNLIGMFGAGDAKFAAAMAGIFVGGSGLFIAALFAASSIAALIGHRIARSIPSIRRATPDWASWDKKQLFPMGSALSLMLLLYLLSAFLP